MSRAAKNVLVITADELRADCTGFGGSADAKTPHLDRLAERGAVFENHFTPFPKCVPARCAMLTGRHPHTDGLRSVSPENHLPRGTAELVGVLRAAGWQTAVLGLNHVWEEGWFYGEGGKANEPGAGVAEMTSFTRGIGHLAKAPVEFPEGRARAVPPELGRVEFRGLLAGRREEFHDVNRAAQAVYWLRECRDAGRPFYLQLNLSNPHPPYAAPEPFYSMFDPERVAPFPFALPENAPLCQRAQRHWRLGDDATEAAMREIRAVYLAMTALADDLTGRVLGALRELGLEESTLVVFTSDHGDYAGECGLVEKWDTDFREGLIRVPFVMAGPGVPRGLRVEGLSDHTDFADTILEYLGVAPPEEWERHGRSLLPMLSGGAGKEAVFAGGGHEAAMRRRFPAQADAMLARGPLSDKQRTYLECPEAMARAKMVRTREWKLVARETGDDELYDLRGDPRELVNLHGRPGYGRVELELQRRLIGWALVTDPDRPRLGRFGA